MTIQRRHLAATALAAAALVPVSGRAAPAGEESVHAALDAMRKAMLAAGKPALEALFLPDATYGHSDGRLQKKDEFIADTVGKKTRWTAITLSDPRITVSGDTAVARVHFVGEAEKGGKTIKPDLTMLVVYKHEHGEWKILTRQGYATS